MPKHHILQTRNNPEKTETTCLDFEMPSDETATTTMTRPLSIVHLQVPTGRLPHLDGLCSLALLGVLLHHFQIPLFSDVFIYFDIFFNLSGYLITRNLLRVIILHCQHLFHTSSYKHRFFRLLQASCFTVLVTVTASIFKLAVAALILWQNVYFHREAS